MRAKKSGFHKFMKWFSIVTTVGIVLWATFIVVGTTGKYSPENQRKAMTTMESVPQPEPVKVMWTVEHSIYAVNTAVEGADTTVVERVLYDKQDHVIRFNQQKSRINNLDQVTADLPNVTPEGTFDGKPMECARNTEMESTFYTVFDCRESK